MPSNTPTIDVRGTYRGRQNNQIHGNQSNNPRTKEPFHCTHCGDMYHKKETWYKLIDYPPAHPKNKEKEQHQHQGYDGHNSHSTTGNPLANQMDFNPTF